MTNIICNFLAKTFILILIFNILTIPYTGSYFVDTESFTDNIASSGWWIVPTVSIAAPVAGDTLYQGNSYSITWTAVSSDPVATTTVDIYYSTDGGTTYPNIIATGEINDGVYSWTMPSIFSSAVKIKITATDSHALINSAESGQFSIKSPIALNEFVPNPVGDDDAPKPGGEWVELYNNGSISVDVNGWILYDAIDTHPLVISISNSDNNANPTDVGETIIPTHGFLVVYRNGNPNFSLNNDGDTVRLYNGPLSSSVLIDSHSYTGTTPINKSYARIPDGIGSWVDPDPTPCGHNVLSENYKNLEELALEVSTPSASLTSGNQEANNNQPDLELAEANSDATPSADTPQIESTPSAAIDDFRTPEAIPSATPVPSPTPTSSPTPDLTPTPALAPEPSSTPTPPLTPEPVMTAEPSLTPEPTPTPEETPDEADLV